MQQVELVVERRLRPIFESIEIGNYKKALQDVEKVLKKNPTVQCGRALKAWAYIRLGKDEESTALIKSLELENPTEATTLHVLTLCYKETHQLDKICLLFGNAVKQLPGNEDLLSQLFVAFMRINDFKSQQTVALQLYKLRPRNAYYFWAVMSVVLQALRGPDSKDRQKAQLLLALSQRMVDKLISENKLETAQEAHIYIQILQHQEKNQEALDFLEGSLCQKLYPGAPCYLTIDLLKKLNKWGDLNRLLKELLLQEQDRWDYYQDYINSTFELIKSQEKPEGADYSVEMCHEFLCDIIESQPKKLRGPHLARLELNRLMVEHKYEEEQLFGQLTDMLADYFRLFGDKPCCVHDMKLFLEHVTAADRRSFATKLMTGLDLSPSTLPASAEQLQRHISALQISRFCGMHATVNEELLNAIYTSLSLHYEHGYSAFGTGLLVTDMGPSDPYALLAAHIMYERAWRLQRSEPLVESLCLLHHLLTNSVNNFHAKLLCLQLYHRLGLVLAAHKMYVSLNIKHIQLDSLGYLHCAQLCIGAVCFPLMAKTLFDRTLNFFINDHQNNMEFPKTSYNFGSFSKLVEFIDFKERLSNSQHFMLVSVESLLLVMVSFNGTLAQNLATYRLMRIKPQDDQIKWSELCDNRDLTIFVNWDPVGAIEAPEPLDTHSPEQTNGRQSEHTAQAKTSRQCAAEMQNVSHEQDHDLLRLRSGLLRLLAAFVELYTHGSEEDYGMAQKLRNHWDTTFAAVRAKHHLPVAGHYLVNLLPSRLHLILRMPYESVFKRFADFLLELWKGECQEGLAKATDRCFCDIGTVFETLKHAIDEYHKSKDLLWDWKQVHETVNACVEIVSLLLFVLTVCYDKYSQAPQISQSTKKIKKKDNNNASAQSDDSSASVVSEKERLVLVTKLLRELKNIVTEMDTVLAGWKSPIIEESLTAGLERMLLSPKGELAVTVEENCFIEMREVRKLLKDKLKLINKSV